MPYDSQRHQRRSIRLPGYNYAQAGAYFVTICVQGGECRFGEIVDGAMQLNNAGRMVQVTWQQLPERFPMVQLDTYVIMPNHFHAIVVITDPDPGPEPGGGKPGGVGAPLGGAPLGGGEQGGVGAPLGGAPLGGGEQGGHQGRPYKSPGGPATEPGGHQGRPYKSPGGPTTEPGGVGAPLVGAPLGGGEQGGHQGRPYKSPGGPATEPGGVGAPLGGAPLGEGKQGGHQGRPYKSPGGPATEQGGVGAPLVGAPLGEGKQGGHQGRPYKSPGGPATEQGGHQGRPYKSPGGPATEPTRPALGDIVGAFKSLTTNAYIVGVRQTGWPPFDRRLWQRGYWDHIIRNDTALERIHHYIATNLQRWELDRENPRRRGEDDFYHWLETQVPPRIDPKPRETQGG